LVDSKSLSVLYTP